MLEVADAGDDHGYAVGVAVVNGVLVADGSSGLYHGVDSGLMGYLDAVGEGEEGVGGHDSSVKVEAKRACLGDGLLEGVDARCLSDAAGKQLAVFGQYDGVALAVLYDLVGKQQVVDLRRGDGFLCGLTEIVGRLDLEIFVLHESAVEYRAILAGGLEL